MIPAVMALAICVALAGEPGAAYPLTIPDVTSAQQSALAASMRKKTPAWTITVDAMGMCLEVEAIVVYALGP